MTAQVGSIELRPVRADGSRSARVVWTQRGEVRRESFRTEWEAVKFREALTRYGGEYPDGYVPGKGYADPNAERDGGRTVAELVYEYSDSNAPRTETEKGREAIRLRFDAMLGGHPLAKARISDVDAELAQAVIDELGRKYAKTTLTQLLGYLRSAFAYAVAKRYLEASPFAGRIKVVSRTGVAVEAVYLRDDEAAALLAAMPDKYKLFTRLILASGIRRGEAFALRVLSVRTLDNGRVVLTVDKSEAQANRKLGPTKNRKTRYVPLPMALSPEITALAAGRPLGARLFDIGWPMAYWNAFTKAVKAAGLLDEHPGGVRIHDLRHTYASRLMSNGADIYSVSKLLGHSSITITANLYGHIHMDDARLMALLDIP